MFDGDGVRRCQKPHPSLPPHSHPLSYFSSLFRAPLVTATEAAAVSPNATSSAGLSIRKVRQLVFEVSRGIYLFTFQHERRGVGGREGGR